MGLPILLRGFGSPVHCPSATLVRRGETAEKDRPAASMQPAGRKPGVKPVVKPVSLVLLREKNRRYAAVMFGDDPEHDPAFRHAQRFRAGVEGTISFLKRVLGLLRCFNKGWEHFAATVGATVFGHNILTLARG